MWLSVIVGSIPFLYFLRRYMQGGQFTKDDVRVDGKVIIVTGANIGLGKETALELAKRSGKIYLACRNKEKSEAALREIVEQSNNKNVFYIPLDLASLESVRNFAKEFLKKESRLDILINNAGLSVSGKTSDGFEMHFGVNHLGPFLLTNLLLDTIKASGRSKIINVSSLAHKSATINKDNINDGSSQLKAYARSKLANILFTRELANRLKGTEVTTNSVHPGGVATNFLNNSMPILYILLTPLLYILFKTARSGAQTTLALALDPDFDTTTGKYFADCKIKEESKNARNDETAKWLWQISEELTGLKK